MEFESNFSKNIFFARKKYAIVTIPAISLTDSDNLSS